MYIIIIVINKATRQKFVWKAMQLFKLLNSVFILRNFSYRKAQIQDIYEGEKGEGNKAPTKYTYFAGPWVKYLGFVNLWKRAKGKNSTSNLSI